MPLLCPSMEYSRASLGGFTIISEAFLSSCRKCLIGSEFIKSLRTTTFWRNDSRPFLLASSYLSFILKKLLLGRLGSE